MKQVNFNLLVLAIDSLSPWPALGAGLRVAIVAGGLGYLAQCR